MIELIEAVIWFLLGHVSGGVIGYLLCALMVANEEKKNGIVSE